MAHFSRLIKVVIDVPASDHDRELAFWEAALGQPLPQFAFPEYHGAGRVARWSAMRCLGVTVLV